MPKTFRLVLLSTTILALVHPGGSALAQSFGGAGGGSPSTPGGGFGQPGADGTGSAGGGGGGAGARGGDSADNAGGAAGAYGGGGTGGDGGQGNDSASAGETGSGGGGGGNGYDANGGIQVVTAEFGGGSGGRGGITIDGGAGGGGSGGYGIVAASAPTWIYIDLVLGELRGGDGGDGGLASGNSGWTAHGGGGGDGGAGAYISAADSVFNIVSGPIFGGAGGYGGEAVGLIGSAVVHGGGGGNGGNGILAQSTTVTNSQTVAGGNGGSGGRSYNAPSGAGGKGGVGISGNALTIFNSGSVIGGAGGLAGAFFGSGNSSANGDGGAGISGSVLAIVNSGTIAGGLSGDGVTRADAVSLSGSGNSFEMHAGSSTVGNVVVAPGGGLNTFALGGSASGTFDVSNLVALAAAGPTTQYAGFDAFEKRGISTWTLAGTSTFAGPLSITGGTLNVDGSIASFSSLLATARTRVGGTGILPITTVEGALAPGNSIGTIIVQDRLVFAPGSTYEVEVSPVNADRTNVVAGLFGNGNADLSGAQVVTSYGPGTYVKKEHVILSTAGGLDDTRFAGLSSVNLPVGVQQSLRYDANNVYLTVSLGALAGLTTNAQAVQDAINRFFEANPLPGAFLGLSEMQLSQLAGNLGAAATGAGFAGGSAFIDMIAAPDVGGEDGTGGSVSELGYAMTSASGTASAERFGRLSYGAEELAGGAAGGSRAMRLQHRLDAGFGEGGRPRTERYTVWGAALGGGIYLAADPVVGSLGVTGSTVGLASGFDWSDGMTRAGVALGASWSSSSLAGGVGSAHVGNFNAGVRASHDFGQAYIAGALAYGLHPTAISRSFGGETYSAAFLGQSVSARAEAGWRFRTAAVDVAPFLARRVVSFSTPAYAETGSGAGTFALAYNAATAIESRSELGIRLNKSFDSSDGGRTTLSGMLGWAHYFSRGRTVTAGFTSLPGTQFVTQGAAGASDTALVSVGVRHRFAKGLGLSLDADGEFGAGLTGYSARGRVSWSW